MKSILLVSIPSVCLLAACAGAPDHFYMLNTSPDRAGRPESTPTTPMHLSVTVPSLVDRSEMVLNTSPSDILILEHERWAAPLSDQVAQTLARDIEQRRSDLLIGDRRFEPPASQPASLRVDIIRMSAQRNAHAIIEAHWRLVDPAAKVDRLGSDTFTTSVGAGYPAVAQAYSELIGQLADKLAADIGRR